MAFGQQFVLFFVSIAFIVLGVLGSLLTILITFLRHPLTAFKKKNRESAPSILLDQSYGTHGYVRANGIRFHYVAAGDRSKPLMLFLHGFPEFWFSWRYQLKEFQKDFFAVAVDMRGYGDTDHPMDKDGYVIDNLVKDIVELVGAFTQCILKFLPLGTQNVFWWLTTGEERWPGEWQIVILIWLNDSFQ